MTVDVKKKRYPGPGHMHGLMPEKLTSIDDPGWLTVCYEIKSWLMTSLKIQVTKDGEFDYVVAADLRQ